MSKRVLITGGNSGIGLCTAEQLAAKGAEVILACRDQSKGQAALARIKNNLPDAKVRLFELDLADLTKVRGCARRLTDELDGLDVLINNAGCGAGPPAIHRRRLRDAVRGQLHLAPVLLTPPAAARCCSSGPVPG